MKITEFAIEKYGPLKNTGKINPASFNLFFGRNENGKTLTIDALIKLLIGKRTKDFDKIDRVDAIPDGYLKIEVNESAGEKTLPYDGDLPKITKLSSTPLTSSDCRNIFIIRNSDLQLSGEAEFYTGVADRLVGLRTFDLKKIKRNLLEIGRLTPAMDFRDDEKSSRLKARLKKAEVLIGKIENVKERLSKGRYDSLEIDLYKKTSELSAANGMISMYEDAKKREMFEKSSGLLNALESRISVLKGMEIFNDQDFELWQDSEREIKRSAGEISELQGKAADIKKDLSAMEKQSEEFKGNLYILNIKKRRIDDEKINIRRLEDSITEIESDISLRILLKRLSAFSVIITLVIVSAWFFNPSVYLYFAGILSLSITSFLWIYEIFLNYKKRKALREFEQIKLNLARDGVNGNTLEGILNALGKFNEDYEKTGMKSGEFESRVTTLRRHLKETEEKILGYKTLIEDYEKRIFSLKTKSGLGTMQEYGEMLKAKRNNEKERDGISNRLEGMLEIHGRSMGETLSNIKAKIHELELYRGKGEGIEFNEYNYDDLRNKSKALEDELQKIRDKKNQFETGMFQIEADANDIFLENDERLYCKTLIDLDEIFIRLNNFIKENNKKRSAIINAAQILDEIDKDENERMLELFDGGLSALFNLITNGYYKEVIYDKEEGRIKVKRNNGDVIDAEKLSGGAYDQLYLAIRLALGEKILQSGKGFFIMDDPFIKSDFDRIERQMSVLKKICTLGWQILYFSCKNEIKDILSYDIKSGDVNFIDINWVDKGVF